MQDANFRRIFARRLKRRRAAALQKRKASRSQIEHGATRRTRSNTLGGRGLSPDTRGLLVPLPIARLIRANRFGLHGFGLDCCVRLSLFDLSLAAASSVSQPSVSLFRSCQGTASAVPKDKTDAILPIARLIRANKDLGLVGRGFSPDKRGLQILLPIARFIRANDSGFVRGLVFRVSIFDLRVSSFGFVGE